VASAAPEEAPLVEQDPLAWSARALATLLSSLHTPFARALALLRVTDVGLALIGASQTSIAALDNTAALAWAGLLRLTVVATARVAWAIELGGQAAKQALRPAALRFLRVGMTGTDAFWPPPPYRY
jgi:hypothetical protein